MIQHKTQCLICQFSLKPLTPSPRSMGSKAGELQRMESMLDHALNPALDLAPNPALNQHSTEHKIALDLSIVIEPPNLQRPPCEIKGR